MSGITELCNQTLSMLTTRTTITSIDERSNEAIQLKINFDSVRDVILRSAPWDFAKRDITLSMLKAAPGTPENPGSVTVWDPVTHPPLGWLYSYSYPSQAVRVRYLKTQPGYSGKESSVITRFSRGGDEDLSGNDIVVILANIPSAIACYTKVIANPELWDSQFENAFTAGLAASVCMVLTGKESLKKQLLQETQIALNEAMITNGNEGFEVYDFDPDWILARQS
jgi:hypothetical protein